MTTLTAKQVKKLIDVFEDTPSEQIQAIFASGLLTDLRDGNIDQVDREGFRQVLGFGPLLKVRGTISVAASTEPFAAKEHFVSSEKVRINFTGGSFHFDFLNKIEEPKGATELRYMDLTYSAHDTVIFKMLGDTAETTLTEVFALVERQGNGEDGPLLVGGWATGAENNFYVRDTKGELRLVVVSFGPGGGWKFNVAPEPVTSSKNWGWRRHPNTTRVFSRNS